MADTATITTLPRPLTPLIGRERELEMLLELLRSHQQLVTITGIGGMGKTRLAHQVALELEPEFAGGAVFVPLAEVRDANLIPNAIARMLGATHELIDIDAVANALGQDPRLLVLDNLEQIPNSGAVVEAILERLPLLNILCTSQIPLQVQGEQLFPLDPMPTPVPESESNAEDLHLNPAVSLFLQRAKAANPHQQYDVEEVKTVAEICRMLDGIPLAIELAAGRTSILSPKDLQARMSNRLEVLAGGSTTAPDRLRTMRNAIAWSYDLLDESERRLFRYLGIYAGGISLEALAHTLQTLEITTSTLDTAEFLGTRGLLRRIESLDDAPRFQMLQTLREFAQERLSEHGDDFNAKLSHATFITKLAEEAEPNLTGKDQLRWHRRMKSELDNILAACEWAAETRPDLTLRTIVALLRLFESQGNMRIYREIARTALAKDVSEDISARGWMALGTMEMRLREALDSAEVSLNRALTLARTLNDHETETHSLFALGTTHLYKLNLDSATSLYLQVENLAQKDGPLSLYGGAILNQGLVDFYRGSLDDARDKALQSVGPIEESGDQVLLARAYINLGVIYVRKEEPRIARDYLHRAVEISREIGHVANLIQALGALGNAHMELGDTADAQAAYDETIALTQQTHHRVDELEARTTAILIPLQNKDWPTVARELHAALSIQTGAEGVRATCVCASVAMLLALEAGKRETAAALWGGTTKLAEFGSVQTMSIVSTAGEELFQSFADDEFSLEWMAYQRGLNWSKLEIQQSAAQMAYEFTQTVRSTSPQDGPIAQPNAQLTAREKEVLALMAQGNSNAEIADSMFISLRTITTHASNIFMKLDVKNRSAAVAHAQKSGLLQA